MQTTSCFRARFVPSYTGTPAEPLVYPPPCSQTITGRLPPLAGLGVQTFRTRQSSLMAPGPIRSPIAFRISDVLFAPLVSCGAGGPIFSASVTPIDGLGATAGRNRIEPSVEAP